MSLFNVRMRFIEKPTLEVSFHSKTCKKSLLLFEQQPFWLVEVPSENDIKIITNRSVSIRSCMELWSYANSIDLLHESLKKYPQQLMDPYLKANKSFKVEIETFCKHFTQKEKVEKIEVLTQMS